MNPSGVRRPDSFSASVVEFVLVTMDVTIMNVALPAIHTGLKSTIADVQWRSTVTTS